MDSNFEEAIRRLAAEQVGKTAAEVTLATSFTADLGYDSLDAVDFVMKVEDALKVRIPEEMIDQLPTVGSVVEYVRGQQS